MSEATVFVVDDDPSVRGALDRLLRGVRLAGRPAAADRVRRVGRSSEGNDAPVASGFPERSVGTRSG